MKIIDKYSVGKERVNITLEEKKEITRWYNQKKYHDITIFMLGKINEALDSKFTVWEITKVISKNIKRLEDFDKNTRINWVAKWMKEILGEMENGPISHKVFCKSLGDDFIQMKVGARRASAMPEIFQTLAQAHKDGNNFVLCEGPDIPPQICATFFRDERDTAEKLIEAVGFQKITPEVARIR